MEASRRLRTRFALAIQQWPSRESVPVLEIPKLNLVFVNMTAHPAAMKRAGHEKSSVRFFFFSGGKVDANSDPANRTK